MAFDAPAAAHASDIQSAARRIQRDNPRLAPGHYVPAHVMAELRTLAVDCGMTYALADKSNSADLLSVYRVALRDPEAAKRTARKIAERLGQPLREAWMDALPEAPPYGVTASDLAAALRTLEGDLKADFADLMTDASRSTLDAMRDTLATEAERAARAALANMQPTRLEVQFGDAPPVAIGLVHKQTARVIRYLAAGKNVYLHGPAGSGKTTLAYKVAEAFKVTAYFAAKVENEYQLMGYADANGKTFRTQFREAYEHGGVFLFDELDGSSASAVVALNMALANGHCAFPDGMVARHPDFKCIGAGNTTLGGATQEYQGRNQLDAASVDRFVFVEFGYDLDLERALCPNAEWVAYVQAVRAAAKERALPLLVTPRASIDGAALIASGDTWAEAAQACIFKGLDADTVATLQDVCAYAFKG